MPKNRKKIIMSRLVKKKDADSSFDFAFWKKAGANARFEAAWQMVCDLEKWKPGYVHQQRLRRSIASLKQR